MTIRNSNIISILRALPSAATAMMAALLLVSCRIEPPLKLADSQPVEVLLPELITDIEAIWGDGAALDEWWYGWDADDISMFGSLDYPIPESYEVRLYYFGEEADAAWRTRSTLTIDGNSFRRAYYYGFYDMMTWSNIVTPDQTQTVLINEENPDDIHATTTETRLRFAGPARSGEYRVYNGPEIFYSGLMPKFYVSRNPEDYDYFDEERKVWVKHLKMEVSPMVYTYLVQVVIYNNNGRIRGISEQTAVSSVARGVSLHTGQTSEDDAVVCFDMRMKQNRKARQGKDADILGGKMTTFGLCGMQPWVASRADHVYNGTRTDLNNEMLLNLRFQNEMEKSFTYDVTPQMRRQAHGGVITIEIDADTITVPVSPGGAPGAGFDPVINGYDDEEEHEFDM